MHFTALSLRQFRHFVRFDLVPGPGINVLIGPNGSGKSNVLEGLSLLATGRSHCGAEARHWIMEGKNESALVGHAEGEESLAMDFRQKRGRARHFRVNHHLLTRSQDWTGRLPLVSFSPEALDLVKGEPALRREAINTVLSQVDGDYADGLHTYTKLLEERNAALRRVRDGLAKPSSLDPWTEPLMAAGARLTVRRHEFLKEFGPCVEERHRVLSGGCDRVGVHYRPFLHGPHHDAGALVESNRKRWADVRQGEMALGTTLVGPHKDDVEFKLDGDLAKVRASQGQARTLALAWKWEERALMRRHFGRFPVCLLDDVFSELDPQRRRLLTEMVEEGGQCFVALTDMAVWGTTSLGDGLLWDMGKMSERVHP